MKSLLVSAGQSVVQGQVLGYVGSTGNSTGPHQMCIRDRRILCGSGSYVYYHGMDYTDEYRAMAALYEHPNEGTLAAWNVGYVLFDSSVYGKFADADESWYAARYPIWYENDGCRVYKIV